FNKQNEKALEYLNALVATPPSRPEHLEMLNEIVVIQREQKELDKGIQAFSDYLQRFPETPLRGVVIFSQGVFSQEAGKEEESKRLVGEALKDFQTHVEKAVGADEKSDWLLKVAGVYQYQRDFETARKTLRRILDEFPLSSRRPLAFFRMAALEE